MRFAGIDLAWKIEDNPRNERCAVTIIDSQGCLLGNRIMKTDEEIVDYVHLWPDEEGLLIGIDAPLTVPEWVTTQRKCEYLLGKMDLPAYPANRKLFIKTFNGVRGENLVNLLETTPGFAYVDSIKTGEATRAVMEIYPYATLKVLHWEKEKRKGLYADETFNKLFNQIRVPKYKGAKINKADKVTGLRKNIALMQQYITVSDRRFSNSLVKENFNIINPDIRASMTILQLEQVADYFDSAVAAYTVLRYWEFGNERSAVVGNKEDGYILIPVDEYIQANLDHLSLWVKSP